MRDTGKAVHGLLLVAEYLENPDSEINVSRIACETLCEIEKSGAEIDTFAKSLLEVLADGGNLSSDKKFVARYFKNLAGKLRRVET